MARCRRSARARLAVKVRWSARADIVGMVERRAVIVIGLADVEGRCDRRATSIKTASDNTNRTKTMAHFRFAAALWLGKRLRRGYLRPSWGAGCVVACVCRRMSKDSSTLLPPQSRQDLEALP